MTKISAPEPATGSKAIENARLIRMPRGDKLFPAAVFKGKAPAKGDDLLLRFGDVVYTGVVMNSTTADGETLVEFSNGLTPVK